MLSKMKSLPANFSSLRFSELLRRFFVSIRIFCFSFIDLNFPIAVSLFFRKWHAWRSSGITSGPVRQRALKTLCSSSFLLIDAGTGFISIDSRRWYWALLTAFLSSWMILSLRRRFYQFASMILGIVDCFFLVEWFFHLQDDCNFLKQLAQRIESQIF